MNMEVDNSFTGSGILQNGLANNMTLGAGPSHYASNIASNTRNYQVEDMTLEVRMSICVCVCFMFFQHSVSQFLNM